MNKEIKNKEIKTKENKTKEVKPEKTEEIKTEEIENSENSEKALKKNGIVEKNNSIIKNIIKRIKSNF